MIEDMIFSPAFGNKPKHLIGRDQTINVGVDVGLYYRNRRLDSQMAI